MSAGDVHRKSDNTSGKSPKAKETKRKNEADSRRVIKKLVSRTKHSTRDAFKDKK